MSDQAAENFKSTQELKTTIAQLASESTEFRDALIENPQATVETLLQAQKGSMGQANIRVIEELPGQLVLTIPADLSNTELNDEQLDAVAGGSHWLTDLISKGWPPRGPIRWPFPGGPFNPRGPIIKL